MKTLMRAFLLSPPEAGELTPIPQRPQAYHPYLLQLYTALIPSLQRYSTEALPGLQDPVLSRTFLIISDLKSE